MTKHTVSIGSIWAFNKLNVWTLHKISYRDPFLEYGSTNLHLSTLSLRKPGRPICDRLSFFNRSNTYYIINWHARTVRPAGHN